jgi:hypothetical protein
MYLSLMPFHALTFSPVWDSGGISKPISRDYDFAAATSPSCFVHSHAEGLLTLTVQWREEPHWPKGVPPHFTALPLLWGI